MLSFRTDIDELGRLICKMNNPEYADFGTWLSSEAPTGGGGNFGAGWCLRRVCEIVESIADGSGPDGSYFSTNSHAVNVSSNKVFLEDLAFEERVSPEVNLDDFLWLLKEWDSISSADEIAKIREGGAVDHSQTPVS